jgi:hypothetical protein
MGLGQEIVAVGYGGGGGGFVAAVVLVVVFA